MLKRILVNGLLTSILQIGVYVLIIYNGWSVGKLIHEPTSEEIYEFTFELELTSIFFGLLLVAANLLIAIINRQFWTWATIIALASFLFIGWIRHFEFSEWRTSLFMFAGILTVFSKFVVEKSINMFTKWIDSGFVTH
jgi:hypothetical protein